MRYMLNVCYFALLAIASPSLIYGAIRFGKYREGWAEKLLGRLPRRANTSPRIWFHAVSVGEVNLLEPILAGIRAACHDLDVVVTTTTKTGLELARRKYPECTVSYCPLDFSWAIRNSFARLAPDLLVLVELELWPNLLMEARRRGVPVAVINGRLSERSVRGYLRLKRLFRHCVQSIALVTAQSPACAQRFVRLGIAPERVHAVGSIKFDGAGTHRENLATQSLRRLAALRAEDVVFLAGSTQAPEEMYAIEVYRQLVVEFPQLRFVLVPRHPQRANEVARLFDASGLSYRRRSQLSEPLQQPDCILVDTVGELASWWGCADIGFVGGSLGTRGGQNMLEPAGLAVATCFGPKTRNFRDVVAMLLQDKAAVVVQDQTEMGTFVRRCLESPQDRRELGQRAQSLVLRQRGAAATTVSRLVQLLTQSSRVAFSPHGDQRSITRPLGSDQDREIALRRRA